MTDLQRPPFVTTRLEEERAKDKGRVLSIRFNEDEYKQLQAIMDTLDTTNEGRVIKILMKAGYNVLQANLGPEILKWLARRDRARVMGAND